MPLRFALMGQYYSGGDILRELGISACVPGMAYALSRLNTGDREVQGIHYLVS